MERVPPLRLVAVVALAAAVVVATSPGRAAASAPPRVTVLTDSTGDVLTTVSAARLILSRGLDLRVDTQVCRKLAAPGCYAGAAPPPSVLDAVRAAGSAVGPIAVVQVGYNDIAEDYRDGLDRVMAALRDAGVQHVVWVTLDEAQPTWAAINAVVRAAPSRWPALTVADWAPRTAGHPEWFVSEPHMNDAGGIALATFLYERIVAVCGAACMPPEAIATLRQPLAGRSVVTVRWSGNATAATYDVALRRTGRTWATVASGLTKTTYRVRPKARTRLQVRVRARDAQGVAGRWSAPATLRAR